MPAPEGVPTWAWRGALWVVGGIMAVISTLLGWIGKRYIEHRQSQIDDLRQDIEQLQEKMGGEHADVEDQVARLDDKIDQLIKEVSA